MPDKSIKQWQWESNRSAFLVYVFPWEACYFYKLFLCILLEGVFRCCCADADGNEVILLLFLFVLIVCTVYSMKLLFKNVYREVYGGTFFKVLVDDGSCERREWSFKLFRAGNRTFIRSRYHQTENFSFFSGIQGRLKPTCTRIWCWNRR